MASSHNIHCKLLTQIDTGCIDPSPHILGSQPAFQPFSLSSLLPPTLCHFSPSHLATTTEDHRVICGAPLIKRESWLLMYKPLLLPQMLLPQPLLPLHPPTPAASRSSHYANRACGKQGMWGLLIGVVRQNV